MNQVVKQGRPFGASGGALAPAASIGSIEIREGDPGRVVARLTDRNGHNICFGFGRTCAEAIRKIKEHVETGYPSLTTLRLRKPNAPVVHYSQNERALELLDYGILLGDRGALAVALKINGSARVALRDAVLKGE